MDTKKVETIGIFSSIVILAILVIGGISTSTYIELKEIELKAKAIEALKDNVELRLNTKDLKDILGD